ncbi:MAG: DEAD/DEAH box helicase [Candidatus Anammoxibacter sp.]
MNTNTIFEKLKAGKEIIPSDQKRSCPIYFQINFNDKGAYILIIRQDNRKEVEVDYRNYSGHTRELLRLIENIKDEEAFQIDWEEPDENIYLAKNEFLLRRLEKCSNFVDDKLSPVQFVGGEATLVFSIEGDSVIKSKLVLLSHAERLVKLCVLTSNHVFAGGKIFTVRPIGENFQRLQWFETEVNLPELDKMLSLFYSYFEDIPVEYKDYKQMVGDACVVQPALVFEKIAAGNSLYLRVTKSMQGFASDFLEDHDITKVASINEFEQTIVVKDVIQSNEGHAFDSISKMLTKHKKELKNSPSNDFFVENNLFVIGEDLSRCFILKELPTLLANFTIFGAEKIKSYKVQVAHPKLNLSLKHGIDFLEGDANLEINGQKFPLFDAINQFRKDSYILLNDGTRAVINQTYIDKLNRLFKKKDGKVKISFFDLPIVEELIDEKVAEESFAKSRAIFLGFNKLKDEKCKLPAIKANLRPYQEQGYKWIKYLHKHNLGGCLADDMGLGKTLQVITMLAKIYPKEKRSSLVIMPKSLLFNWENEFLKFKTDISFHIYYGNNRDFKKAKESNVILTTYGMVRNNIEIFKEDEFYYVILDESQNIKNINSQISKAVMLLNCRHRLAISGTPIENNLGELYALFRFLNPSMFGSADQFRRDYVQAIHKDNDKDAVRELKRKVYPFILRRLKKDVIKDLPDKIEQVLYVDMNEKQKIFYEQRRLFYHDAIKTQISIKGVKSSQFFILQAFNELRQIASTPEAKSDEQVISAKRELLMETMRDSIANGHKVLIFANFLSSIDHIAQDMEKEGINYQVMTGVTKDRKQLVEKFQEDSGIKVFLMTLKTGGVGLNLTAADTIFIYEPWWNKAVESQAIDRTHRIGQDKTVFSYKLITKGTIEEKIMELQEKKSALFDSIISSDNASIKSLDESDIEFVMG